MRNYRRKYDLMVPIEKFLFVVYRGVNEIMNTDFFPWAVNFKPSSTARQSINLLVVV